MKWTAATQNEVADFFGIAVATLCGSWVSRGCPLEKKTLKGVTGYDLSEIARWRLKYLMSNRPKSEMEVLIDASGPDADHWKTEWTKNRAQLAGEELGKVKKQLIHIDEIAPTLRRAGTLLADAIRRLEAEHGLDAAEIMRTPLERTLEEVEMMIDSDDGD